MHFVFNFANAEPLVTVNVFQSLIYIFEVYFVVINKFHTNMSQVLNFVQRKTHYLLKRSGEKLCISNQKYISLLKYLR